MFRVSFFAETKITVQSFVPQPPLIEIMDNSVSTSDEKVMKTDDAMDLTAKSDEPVVENVQGTCVCKYMQCIRPWSIIIICTELSFEPLFG